MRCVPAAWGNIKEQRNRVVHLRAEATHSKRSTRTYSQAGPVVIFHLNPRLSGGSVTRFPNPPSYLLFTIQPLL